MYRLIRSLLFQLDAESAHELTVEQIRRIQHIPLLLRAIAAFAVPPPSARTIWGLTFRTPIGIAAGFDKNAVMMPFLAAIGFGFIEVGTVTLLPQPGNPRPRIFRYPQDCALVNRLGFNNDGAEAVAARLRGWERTVPLLVNIGKNRDVPLERATEAYVECYRRVAPHADVAVLNVSSPNTPGLRELQRPEHLEELLAAIATVRSGPVLVKIAPDLDDAQIAEICDVCASRADGMICTNTTAVESGGLSGKPLLEKSTRVLAQVRQRVDPHFPLIGVGGVFTPEDARTKFVAGADLVQVYTGFVYEGPSLPSRIARALNKG